MTAEARGRAAKRRKALGVRRKPRGPKPETSGTSTWHFYAYSSGRCLSGFVEAPTYEKAMSRAKKFLRALGSLVYRAKREEFEDCYVNVGFGKESPITIVMNKEPT